MNRPGVRTGSRRRLRGDSGVVLVEFGLVFPFLMLLSMGVLEFGFIFRSNVMVSDSANAITRTLSNFGSEREADHNSLLAGVAGLSTLPGVAELHRVVIFDADAASSDIDTCKTMPIIPGAVDGVDGVCNVYTGDALIAMDGGDFDGDPDCDIDDWDHWFCPTDRIDKIHDDLTAIGVWVDVEQNSVTHMFPWVSLHLDEQRIMHLGPDVGDDAAPLMQGGSSDAEGSVSAPMILSDTTSARPLQGDL